MNWAENAQIIAWPIIISYKIVALHCIESHKEYQKAKFLKNWYIAICDMTSRRGKHNMEEEEEEEEEYERKRRRFQNSARFFDEDVEVVSDEEEEERSEEGYDGKFSIFHLSHCFYRNEMKLGF
jgi:hypothetical protein